MIFTALGIVTDDSPLQPLNAFAGILVTPEPMVRVVRFVQPLKTGFDEFPMFMQLTALKLTEVRPLQPLKTSAGILATSEPTVSVTRFVQS